MSSDDLDRALVAAADQSAENKTNSPVVVHRDVLVMTATPTIRPQQP